MRSFAVEWLASRFGQGAADLLVPGWFACMAAAWLVVSMLTLRTAARRGDDLASLAWALAIVYTAAIAGGIALPALVAAATALWNGHGFRLRWAGMVSYAGFSCGAAALLLALRRSRTLYPARAADLLAAPLGIGLCIGRFGCFLAGCDYGRVSSLPWAVRFPAGSPAWRDHLRAGWIAPQRASSLPVHPTQLYESILGLALCAMAVLVARTAWARRKSGRVFGVVAVGYALGRMAIENARGDLGRGLVGPWSSAQLFCTLLLAAVAFMRWRGRHPARSKAAATAAAVALIVMSGAAHAGEPTPVPAPVPVATPAQTVDDAPTALPTTPPGATPATTRPVAAPAPARDGDGVYRLGALLVGASSLNRRDRQVPPLGGASLTAGVRFDHLGLELDLESVANEVASHRSALFAVTLGGAFGQRLSTSVRFGVGVNLVDFDDPAFESVRSGDLRMGGELGLTLSPHWTLLLRPIEFDVIGARALGGPIWTYRFQMGIAYQLTPTPTVADGRASRMPGRGSAEARRPAARSNGRKLE